MEGDDRYLIDTNTQTCALAVAGAASMNVSCWKLADVRPEAKGHMPWIRETPAPKPAPLEVATTPPDRDALDRLVRSRIHKVSDTEFEIKRSLFLAFIANPMLPSREARSVPAIKGGRPNGLKLFAIRPNSVFDRLGLMNGDTVHQINGYDLSSPDRVLEVFMLVREAQNLVLDLTRRGRPGQLRYSIVAELSMADSPSVP